ERDIRMGSVRDRQLQQVARRQPRGEHVRRRVRGERIGRADAQHLLAVAAVGLGLRVALLAEAEDVMDVLLRRRLLRLSPWLLRLPARLCRRRLLLPEAKDVAWVVGTREGRRAQDEQTDDKPPHVANGSTSGFRPQTSGLS